MKEIALSTSAKWIMIAFIVHIIVTHTHEVANKIIDMKSCEVSNVTE